MNENIYIGFMAKRLIISLLLFASSFTVRAQFELNGSAIQTSGNCYQLTDEQNFIVGTAWATQMVSLNDPFDLTFEIFLGNDDNGADGMVFGLQPVSTSAGAAGVGIGFGGIVPSLGIEFDTYANAFDPSFDHVAIIRDGVVDHTTANTLFGPVQMDPFDVNTEDGQTHLVQIIWDPATQNMQLFFDCNPVIGHTFTNNVVADIFGGDSLVHWGFTSATGGQNNVHSFCLVSQNFVNQSQEVTICLGDSVQLTFTGGQNYNWSPSTFISDSTSATPSFFPPDTTIYTVQVSDSCGNTWTDTAKIYPITPPNVNLGIDTLICDTAIEYTGTYDPFNLLWSTGDTTDTVIIDTNTTLWLEASVDQCVVSDTVEISFGVPTTVDLGVDTTICQGDSVIFDLSGQSYSNILWNSGSTDSIIVTSQSGTYAVTVTEDSLCSASDSINLIVLQAVTPDLGSDTLICDNDSITLSTGIQPSGVSFLWSTGSQDSTLTLNQAGVYIVSVSAGSCSGQDTMELTVQPTPNFFLGNDTTMCDTGSIFLYISAPASNYLWSNGSTDSSAFFSPNTSSFVWGQATVNGCRFRDSLAIEVDTLLSGSLPADTTLCLGDTFQIPSNLPSFSDDIYTFFENTSDLIQSASTPDTVWFYAENACGSRTDTLLVNYYSNSSLSLSADSIYCADEVVNLVPSYNSPSEDTLSWSTGEFTDSISVASAGIYTVSLSDRCGVISESVTVLFESCETPVYIPNIFSPNGDGVNDFFEMRGPENQDFTLTVYNRWGQVMFFSDNPKAHFWNGRTYSGIEASTGTYFYVLESENGEVFKGSIMLTR